VLAREGQVEPAVPPQSGSAGGENKTNDHRALPRARHTRPSASMAARQNWHMIHFACMRDEEEDGAGGGGCVARLHVGLAIAEVTNPSRRGVVAGLLADLRCP
jgi:hypothetical protein